MPENRPRRRGADQQCALLAYWAIYTSLSEYDQALRGQLITNAKRGVSSWEIHGPWESAKGPLGGPVTWKLIVHELC
jgi:hypothetical protein